MLKFSMPQWCSPNSLQLQPPQPVPPQPTPRRRPQNLGLIQALISVPKLHIVLSGESIKCALWSGYHRTPVGTEAVGLARDLLWKITFFLIPHLGILAWQEGRADSEVKKPLGA